MNYEIRHFDTSLLLFSATEDSSSPEIDSPLLLLRVMAAVSEPLWHPAPLFDHGNSLFNYAGQEDDLTSEKALKNYADTLLPCEYDDFVGTAKQVLSLAHKEGLRHLLTFKFKKHSRYNLPDIRLKLIEKQVQQRARELLSE